MSRRKQASELELDIARAACLHVAERLTETLNGKALTVEQLNAVTGAILRIKESLEPPYVSPGLQRSAMDLTAEDIEAAKLTSR